MIICIIGLSFICLFAIMILLGVIADRKASYYRNKCYDVEDQNLLAKFKKKRNFWDKLDRRTVSETCSIYGGLSVIIILILALIFAVSKSSGKRDYDKYVQVTDALNYCMENDIEIDYALINDTLDINKKVEKYKKEKADKWVNWFIYNDICDLELIDLNVFK